VTSSAFEAQGHEVYNLPGLMQYTMGMSAGDISCVPTEPETGPAPEPAPEPVAEPTPAPAPEPEPAPAPAATYIETTGSRSDTFTDYANASGLGMPIAGGTAIEVSCRT
jgi:hypothetical protein